MEKKQIATPCGLRHWHHQEISRILSNEKYVGDSLCQKTYTTSTFPFVQQLNHGNADQYYIENTHPAIITKEIFEKAQALRRFRARQGVGVKAGYPLALKVFCGKCGSPFTRRATNSGLVSWVCRKHDDRAADCPIGRIPEAEIYGEVIRLTNAINRALEHLSDPEDMVTLILQGVSAQYNCCSAPTEQKKKYRLSEADLKRFGQAVSHITITGNQDVTVHFK